MKNLKIALLLLTLIFFVSVSMQANEQKAYNQQRFSFISHSKNISGHANFNFSRDMVTNYKWSNQKKSNFFLKMGIAGAAVAGGSWILIIPGIALLAVSYSRIGIVGINPYYLSAYSTEAYGLYIGGAVLIGLGIPACIIGIGLLVPGFVLYAIFKKKVSMFIDSDINSSRVGFAIKL